ncbi:YheC/YheD family protein [Halobacillus sp. Cin3]|uniref:YheC/YheD family protein n=1 Tax=Halobacillus sp. Cin3 TaxID=2928441 RepID=UPI00248E043D|nr:YheC/YheD family protein [Halobacillus sp. Cin3]
MFIKKNAELSQASVAFHPSMKDILGQEGGTSLDVHLGLWKRSTSVFYHNHVNEDVVEFSYDLLHGLTIPEDIDFEWMSEKDGFHLGPVLGILRGTSLENIRPSVLRIMRRWVVDYKNLKGLVIVFPRNGVQSEGESVTGYGFAGLEKGFCMGTFPFPSAVFSRPSAGGERTYRLLDDLTSGRFFNRRGAGKWGFYCALRQDPATEKLVPHTEKYSTDERLMALIDQYTIVYWKRKFGAKGYGMIQMKKEADRYIVTRVLKGEQKQEVFSSEGQLKAYLSDIPDRKRGLIQQGVPYAADGKQVDFRAYVQKDPDSSWKMRGFVGRIARTGSVITNLRYTEKVMKGTDALQQFYGIGKKERARLERKVEAACLLAAARLDEDVGHFGDIALDFIISDKGDLYFLEVNANYGHASLVRIGDESLKHSVYRSPLAYAKSLTGFSGKA